MITKTFLKGGIHPADNKLSASNPIQRLDIPDIVYIPLLQHIGSPPKLIVNPQEKVKTGQLIAESTGFISANIHSSVTGTVLKIDDVMSFTGYKEKAVETSYNYFALDEDANVIYFGEASYEYDDEGNPVLDEGSWRADDPGNLPGIIMPGEFEKGDKYYQEYAPEVAMDRAENIKHNKNFKTDLGKFKHCILIEETTPLEPDAEEIKIHAPGVGIIADEDLWITFYGYV